jgi:hypothetical protein
MLFDNYFGFILCFVLRSFSFLFSSCFVCVFFFAFVSRSCLWPLLLFQLSFCRSRFSSLALVFGYCLAFASYFCFLLFIYGFYLAFISCFWLLSSFHFLLLSFIFCLWVKAHYIGPKATDVVFIISLFHNVKLKSLFQNHKHSPLELIIYGFQKRFPLKILHTIYILKCNLKFTNVWISRTKFNS